MLSFFKNFFNYNQREVERLRKRVTEINSLEDKARVLKDEDFVRETDSLKEEIKSGRQTLDNVLPWAYALVREASRRVLNERHFDEQLMAGIVLHEGKIAEQKTGEGKTLSATTALYLNALEGKGAHLVTVNDYLARRDAGWMGEVFYLLGLTVSAMISEQSFLFDVNYVDHDATDWRLRHLRPITRKEAYDADITYGINSEFGFDYLRDNMALTKDDCKQRAFRFAIIDEVDSVLIDEARTPHIISAPYEEDTSKYYQYSQMVGRLDPDSDYIIDEKLGAAHLTEKGVLKIEKMTGTANIYEKDFDTLFHLEAALKAKTLFKKDKDYIVADNEVIIVDEFTGRLLHGRRFSEGLHQAIEAKEKVSIKRESKTLATVSLQNYFRLYQKLAGMTGTAATEAEEFHKIYKLEVIVVPTHRQMIRKDHADVIYKTEKGKLTAVAEEIMRHHQIGRPVLVGTTSIEKNELLSSLLKRKGVPHELLNAKNHEREAFIISNAGRRGAVTVATNMAGRGVDIILGGQPPSKYQTSNIKNQKENQDYENKIAIWRKDHEEVVGLGGLYVIGTERHESRRIDNQLRGRAGRQGDPGETRFFVSLQDDLMRIFGGEQVSRLMTFFKIPENQPLEHSLVSKALEQAQVKVEGFNFDTRKHLVDFDDVLNKQRSIVYQLRRNVLTSACDKEYGELKQKIFEIFQEQVATLVSAYTQSVEPDLAGLVDEYVTMMPLEKNNLLARAKTLEPGALQDFLVQEIEKLYEKKEQEIGRPLWCAVVSNILTTTIDRYWTEHLTAIEDLRAGINLRGYAQLDPLVEYKNEAYSMFEKLLADIHYEVTRRMLKIEVTVDAPASQTARDEHNLRFQSASAINPFHQVPPVSSSGVRQDQSTNNIQIIPPGTPRKKLGRNDPCWCGSGKKYKKCHYPN